MSQQHLDRLAAELAPGAILLPGHGAQARRDLLDWQRGYIERFVGALEAADWSDSARARQTVEDAMAAYLPAGDLRFLMQLSIEPAAAKLGRIEPSDRAPDR